MRISFAEPQIDDQERWAVFKALGGRPEDYVRRGDIFKSIEGLPQKDRAIVLSLIGWEKDAQPNIPDDEGKGPQALNLTNAGNVRAFEERFVEFAGGGEAHAVTSCMGALHIAALNLISPGDTAEVIVPAMTHPATAFAVTYAGGVPVFVDVSRETGNMEPEDIRGAITKNTKGIMVLHYLGRPVDMPAIMAIARDYDLFVIEDCALALGSFLEGQHVGLFGDAGCFSFYPAKHITTCEGGMFLTRHPENGVHAIETRHFGQRHIRDLGILKAAPDWLRAGLNYRMTEIQGAMGVVQMSKLKPILGIRKQNFERLSEALGDLEQIQSGGYSHYGLSVFVPNRNDVRAELKRRSIETSVYYQTPVPHVKAYADFHSKGQFPNAEAISENTICLPVGPHLDPEAVFYIANNLKEIL